jgi:hypothetical protein
MTSQSLVTCRWASTLPRSARLGQDVNEGALSVGFRRWASEDFDRGVGNYVRTS